MAEAIGTLLVLPVVAWLLLSLLRRPKEAAEKQLASVGERLLNGGAFPEREYLEKIQAECRYTHPVGIGDEQVTLDLLSVHVPVRVRSGHRIERLDDAVDSDFASAAAQLATRLGDLESARTVDGRTTQLRERLAKLRTTIGHLSTLSTPFARLSDLDVLSQKSGIPSDILATNLTRRLLLTGHAGSGKSTTLRYAVLQLVNAYLEEDAAALCQNETSIGLHLCRCPFPIYTRLTHFAASLPETTEQLAPRERVRYVGASSSVFIEWLQENNRLRRDGWSAADLLQDESVPSIVLLDGLDETGSEDKRAYVANVINSLVEDYPRNLYVVTSRPQGIRGRVHLPTFLEVELCPLSRSDIEILLTRWFRAAFIRTNRGDASASRESARSLLRVISQSPQLLEMAHNPLLLTVMALMHLNELDLPDQRSRLYDDLIRLLLDTWRKQQTASDVLRRTRTVAELTTEQRRLEHLAFSLHSSNTQGRDFSLARAQQWLRPKLECIGISPDDADAKVAEMLDSLAIDSGLVQRTGDTYTFAHYTFQEFLAARALDGHSDGVAFLLAHADDVRWRETLLLAVGHWSNGQQIGKAEQLIRQLLDRGNIETVLLAGDALLDVGVIEEFGLLRREVGCTLARMSTSRGIPARLRIDAAIRGAQLGVPRVGPLSQGAWSDLWTPGFTVGPAEPRRTVRLTTHPVTCHQYVAFVDYLKEVAPSRVEDLRMPQFHRGPPPGREDYPVLVPRQSALEFAQWIHRQLQTQGVPAEGLTIRLPSVDELAEAGRGQPATEDPFIRRHKPVGVFPEYASEHMAQDIAATNPITEWTNSPTGAHPSLLASFRLACAPATNDKST